jgi:PAS domain S-box-containing protein
MDMTLESTAAPALASAVAHQLLAAVRTGLVLLDASSVIYANPIAAAMFGRSPAALVGRSVAELIAPSHREASLAQLGRRLAGELGRAYDIRCLHGDGSEFDVRIWGHPVDLEGRRVNLVTLTDVTEVKELLRRTVRKADMLARSEVMCRSGSFTVAMASSQITISAGLRALVGGEEDATAAPTLDALPWVPADERSMVAAHWRSATLGEPFEFQHRVDCADGRRLVVLHRGVLSPPASEGGEAVGMGIVKDITARQDAERRIEELANFDEITGMANRANLLQQLDAAVHAARADDRALSLFSIEVPRIAELAGTMGVGAADALAMAVAANLSQVCVDDERIAHLGSGEFALMRQHAGHGDVAIDQQRAAVLRDALQQPISLVGADIFPQCRIGIAMFPSDGEDANQLLAAARTARLNATASDAVVFFKPESNARVRRELQLESALHQALPRGEFSLAYQPQVCLTTGLIIGAEALLRWRSAELGPVAPDEFIGVAERSGRIAVIGDWVIREACEQIVRWRKAGVPPIRIGINISPVQFQLGDVAGTIRKVLRETGASASLLGVELTESALLQDGDRVAATLTGLRASGIEISLDDFGTGFSSLSRLRTLPIDVLKIDRSFVSDVIAAPESASVTRSIINLAHGLQIPVLAEGVETEGQLNMLSANGCDRIQGHFFSQPVSADEMAAMLTAGRRLAAKAMPTQVSRTLLLVDDESSVLSALKRLFRRDGYTILTAASGAEALELLAVSSVDVIVSDQRMPGMTGVDFLRRVKALHPHTIRMTLSGYTDLQSIIDAVNEGAVYKFLVKPWDDERLREHVKKAFEQKELGDDNRRLQREVAGANSDLAAVNRRLEDLLERQREQSQLMQASAGGARDLIDALPAAVFGLDSDGTLAYLNQGAAELVPLALGCLGSAPTREVAQLIDAVRALTPLQSNSGHSVSINQRPHLAWLRSLVSDGVARGEVLMLTPFAQEPSP